MVRITEVIKNLIIINVIIFFAINYLPIISEFKPYFHMSHPSSPWFRPIQIVTHMFNHGSPMHLFMNMLGLFFLGPTVESALGPKRFLFLYLISGLGAVLVHFLFSVNPVVGASGAIFGVVAAFAVMFPNVKLMLMFIPVPIKAKFLISAVIIGSIFVGLFRMMPGIAHFAHVGGALFGALVVLYFRKNPNFLT